MRIIETGDPAVWEARSSGHVGLFLFGLPFFLAGLFVITLPLGLVPVDGDSGPWYIMVPFGSIFATVGLVLMAGRGASSSTGKGTESSSGMASCSRWSEGRSSSPFATGWP